MFGSAKVKLDPELWEKVQRYAAAAGYSSPAELVVHAVEKLVATLEEARSDEEVLERLRGLGYLR